MKTREMALLALVITAPGGLLSAQEADSARAPDTPVHLILAKNVTDELALLADSLAVESMRCLIGITRGTSAVVDLVWDPTVAAQTAGPLDEPRCPLATVAHWRNRLIGAEERPEQACYLSKADIRTAVRPRAPPIQIVQVTSDVACWWTRSQVAASSGANLLESIAGQRRGDPADRRPAACRGALARGNACALILPKWVGNRATARPLDLLTARPPDATGS